MQAKIFRKMGILVATLILMQAVFIPSTCLAQTYPDGTLVSAKDKPVYVVFGGKRYGIPGREVLLGNGYDFNDVKMLSNAELFAIPDSKVVIGVDPRYHNPHTDKSKTFLSASSGSYFGDVTVVNLKYELPPSGYILAGQDLNKTTIEGDTMYLAYRPVSAPDNAITDIVALNGKDTPPPNGYVKIDRDVNAGAGGAYIYLAYAKSQPGIKPITEVEVEVCGYHTRYTDPNSGWSSLFYHECVGNYYRNRGFVDVKWANGRDQGKNADLNQGVKRNGRLNTRGGYVIMWLKR